MSWWKNCCYCVVWWLVCVKIGLATDPVSLPFTVPDGFVVQRVADDALVHDCFCMTLDGLGRPVVSGPGYIRTLIDDNDDGIYDRMSQWTNLPKQGAQGLWSEGRTLYWVGDGGLWQSDDLDGDLVGDPGPRKVLDLPTGGEHDAHAIRRGPDGYWYLIAGNFASTIANLANDPNAPVMRARAGTIWRISPDFSTRGVWAHGMRNCYDFDFLPDGQIVTYDSDCERETTLPWYRPTRVMALGPGADAGWCGSASKDDDSRVTMPTVLSRLGRGSPTGVAVYQHRAFPEKYHDAVFVLDWTFGRVIAVYPSANVDDSQRTPNRIPSEVFMQPSGTAGFAPTDICISPDGSLLICVGGRGTTGAVYRVIAENNSASSQRVYVRASVDNPAIDEERAQALDALLHSACPWESWSELKWRPLLERVGTETLLNVIAGELPIEGDDSTRALLKQRCAQWITRLRSEVPINKVQSLALSHSPAARAACWWLVSRGALAGTSAEKLAVQKMAPSIPTIDKCNDDNAERTRWESHLGPSDQRLRLECMGLKKWSCAAAMRPVLSESLHTNMFRRAWLWALSRSPELLPNKPDANTLDNLLARQLYGPQPKTINTPLFDILAKWIPERQLKMNTAEQLEFLTSLQSCLGDPRFTLPLQAETPNPHAMDSYRALYANVLPDPVRSGWIKWTLFLAKQAKEKGSMVVHAEATRTLAMLEPKDVDSLRYLLDQIDGESHPTSDIHMLCCIANCSSARNPELTKRTASGLAGVIRKVKLAGLYTDNQWNNRLNQLIATLLTRDSQLGRAFVELPIPCCQEDLALLNSFPADVQVAARRKIHDHLISSAPAEWTSALVRYASQPSIDEPLAAALRKGADTAALRSTIVDLISTVAKESDYELFLTTLEASDRNAWGAALRGLNALPLRDPQREFNALAPVVSTMLNAVVALPRDSLLNRMRSTAARLKLVGVPSSDLWADWEVFLKGNLDPTVIERLVQPKSIADWPSIVRSANGLVGDAKRGQSLYQTKCGLCHGGSSALGPSLVGVSKRFSRDDLSRAIFEPSRDIPERYRAIRVLTVDGEIFTGMIVYNAADGTTLQTGDGSILRINQENIEEKAYSTESLMPSGLLDDKSPSEIADLFAYLGRM